MEFTIDQEKCTKCGECANDCPYDVIELSPEYPVIVADREDKCIKCQHCFAICPTGALSIFGKDPEKSIPLKGNLPDVAAMECLIKGRRTVRRYKDEPVEKDIITHMIDVVSNCPTGINNQQLLFTIIDDAAVMKKMRHEVMEGIREALMTDNLPPGLEFFNGLLQAWDDGKDIIFRGAPHMLIVSTPADGPSPEQDTLIAMSYFELLAQSMGLGTVWNGFATWAINSIVMDMKEKLGIPESHLLGYTMVFGKPAVRYHRTVQRGRANVNRVQWAD